MIDQQHSPSMRDNKTPELLSGFRSPSPRLRTFNLLSSPTKITLTNINNYPKSSPEVPHISSSENEFAGLASQFAGLLEQLTEIYTEIGYSKPEMEKNKESLFTLVSQTFDKFLTDSQTYREKLKEENARLISILRSTLKSIDDPSGTRTIPDLYLRNLILKDSQQGATLRMLRKSLESCMDNILKDYRNRLVKVLQHSKTISDLSSKVDGLTIPAGLVVPRLQHEQIMQSFTEKQTVREFLENLVAQGVFDSDTFRDLSDSRISQMTQMITQLQQLREKRIEQLKSTCKDIIELSQELFGDNHQDDCITDTERRIIADDLPIPQDLLETLEKELSELKEAREKRKNELENIVSKCDVLWAKLKEDPHTVRQFKAKYSSIATSTIEAYQKELERLEVKKKEFLKDFIEEARQRLEEMWDLLCISDRERAEFTPFEEQAYTDDLLSKHEVELERLTQIYESYKPVFELAHEFTALIQDRANLEESTKDSSRLLQRNSHKILMEEEKMRKRLSRNLPRVVGALKARLQELEQSIGPVTFLDKELLIQLDEEQKSLESKGRRVVSGQRTRSAAPSRVGSRAPSAAPSRVASRAPSRMPSRQPSRATSPIKTNSSLPSRQQSLYGVQKPTRRHLTEKPTLITSTSCLLPPITSPTREAHLSITSDLMRGRTTASSRVPAPFTRSHSSFQPQLAKLPESNRGSPRRARALSPLKNDSRSNLPLPKKRADNKIHTSPLKSLSRELDTENIPEPMSSDQDDEDTYSNWRKEQLKKLNTARHAAKSLDWETDTF